MPFIFTSLSSWVPLLMFIRKLGEKKGINVPDIVVSSKLSEKVRPSNNKRKYSPFLLHYRTKRTPNLQWNRTWTSSVCPLFKPLTTSTNYVSSCRYCADP